MHMAFIVFLIKLLKHIKFVFSFYPSFLFFSIFFCWMKWNFAFLPIFRCRFQECEKGRKEGLAKKFEKSGRSRIKTIHLLSFSSSSPFKEKLLRLHTICHSLCLYILSAPRECVDKTNTGWDGIASPYLLHPPPLPALALWLPKKP